MSFLYVSTGRKPSVQSRKLGKLLTLLLNAKMENRGKRSIEDCVGRAENLGLKKALFIYETHGNPSELVFYDIEKGNWEPESLLLKKISLPEREKGKRIPEELNWSFEGEKGRKIAAFFGMEKDNIEEGIESELSAIFSAGYISFHIGKEPILFLKFELVKQKA